ncbi:MAG: hypothetical protein AB7T07_09590 [Steroidobacteraceae bacterium]
MIFTPSFHSWSSGKSDMKRAVNMLASMPRINVELVNRLLLMMIALGSVAWMVHMADYWQRSLQMVGLFAVIAGGVSVASVCVYLALRGRVATIKHLVRELFLLVLVLLLVEAWVINEAPATWTDNVVAGRYLERQQTARKLGVRFDPRTVSEVVADLREQGIDALPGVSRSWPGMPQVRKRLPEGFYPLSHASNAQIVECNEDGQYLVYGTDEFGFNNPSGLVASGQIDVAIVGESHVLGHCVAPGESFVDVVRGVFPRTANFALAYTLSLSQLGSVREYVEPLKPPLVLWVVNPGLAVTSGDEGSDPVLRRYLDPAFSQNLLYRQAEVDAAVRTLSLGIQATSDHELRQELQRAESQRFSRLYALGQVRARLDMTRRWQRPPPGPDTALFEQSLRLANATVDSWGGRLVVAVMPSYAETMGERKESMRHHLVMDIVNRLGIEAIDGAALFLAQVDGPSLFAMNKANHPNAAGHALLGRYIVEELRRKKLDLPSIAIAIQEPS